MFFVKKRPQKGAEAQIFVTINPEGINRIEYEDSQYLLIRKDRFAKL